MSDHPEYLRLTNRLRRTCAYDLASGWGISGLDVRTFPEDPAAAKYALACIRDGKMEPASRAEYEEAKDNPLEEAMLAERPDFKETASLQQEQKLQDVAAAAQKKLEKARLGDPTAAERYEVEKAARAARTGVGAASDDEGELTKTQLQERLRELGLPTSGSKAELAARLEEAEEETE